MPRESDCQVEPPSLASSSPGTGSTVKPSARAAASVSSSTTAIRAAVSTVRASASAAATTGRAAGGSSTRASTTLAMLLISLRCFQAITSAGNAILKVALLQSEATCSSRTSSAGSARSGGTRPRCRIPDIGTPRMITSAGCRCTAGIQMQTPKTRRT